jgi:hypothetical protein
VTGDTNNRTDIFVRDTLVGMTVRASVDSTGLQANGNCSEPAISPEGGFVGFRSGASNLVGFDSNGKDDVFLHDRTTGSTERVSVSMWGGQSDGASGGIALSANAGTIAFFSAGSTLVPNDTNQLTDVFVRSCVFPGTYCTAGTTSNGCAASISSIGTPSASSPSGFGISVSSVEGQKLGILFYGVNNAGYVPLAWGPSTSFLCVKPPLQRTSPQNAGGTLFACDGVLSIDWNAFRSSNPAALGQPFAAGDGVYTQAWFRDPPSPKTTMLSDALAFTVQP